MKTYNVPKFLISLIAFLAVCTVQSGAASRLVNVDDENDVFGLLIKAESSSEEANEIFEFGKELTPLHTVVQKNDFAVIPDIGMNQFSRLLFQYKFLRLFLLFHSLKVDCI